MIMVIMIIYIMSFKLKYGIVLFIMIERVVYKIKNQSVRELNQKFVINL